MPLIIDKKTRQRIPHAEHIGDIVYNADGFGQTVGSALKDESVFLLGGWVDYTGSGGIQSRAQNWMGISNSLEGTDSALEGAKDFDRNVVGENIQLFRRRLKRIYKKLD